MAYSLETSSVKTIVPGAEVSGFCDVVARQKINEVSGEVPQLSAGEGIGISSVDGKTVISNLISAGQNISLVYDMETNTYRIDAQGGGADLNLNSNVHKDSNKNLYVTTSTSAWSSPTTGDNITTAESNNNKFVFDFDYCYDHDFIVVNSNDYSFKNKNVDVYVSGYSQYFNSYSGSITPTSNNLIIKIKDLVQTTEETATIHCFSGLTIECDAPNNIISTGATYKTYFEEDGHSPDDLVITDKYLNNTTSFYLDSVENLNIGSFNSFGYATSASNGGGYIVGHRNSAYEGGAIYGGALNSAYHESFIGGGRGNTANWDGFCFGEGNYADNAFSFGCYNSAYNLGFTFGRENSAKNFGFCMGLSLKYTSGLALGQYNKTSSGAAFVIGNGSSNSNRKDCFIIDYNGNVSAAGKISANGVELGSVPYNMVYTASLPATPDANTLYLIPEA